MSERLAPFPRGTTQAAGNLDHLLGMVKKFPDYAVNTTTGPNTLRSEAEVTCKLVKNDAGTTLGRRLAVVYKAGYHGKRIGALCGSTEKAAGFVDEHLTTAVPDGYAFWMVIDGPTGVVSNGAGTLAQGDVLVTAASGKVVKQTAAPADTTAAMVQVNAQCAVCQEAVTNVDGTVGIATVKLPFAA